jgi:hypothetical protein
VDQSQFSPAEHIFQWARNDASLHSSMVAARRYPDGGNFTTSRAQALFIVARQAYKEMQGDTDGSYTAIDVLEAAALMLKWDGES